MFSYRHAPLKLPSKILTGLRTNLGPTSDRDKCGMPSFCATLRAWASVRAWVDDVVWASASAEGVSRICERRCRVSTTATRKAVRGEGETNLVVAEPDLAVDDAEVDDMVDEGLGPARRLGDRERLRGGSSASAGGVFGRAKKERERRRT